MYRKVSSALLALFLLAVLPGKVLGQTFSKLVVFSGSLSDTGNCLSINCEPAFAAPPFFQGRSTNGPNAIDTMASLMELSSAPSLNLTGPEQGTNYAVFGALAFGNGAIDLPAQISAYLQPRSQAADPNALYFFFIGGNDVINAIFQPDTVAETTLSNAALGIEEGVRRIANAGGKTILVGNFIDIGTAPVLRTFGLSAVGTQRSQRFNTLLAHKMRSLEHSLGIKILKFDFFAFGQQYFGAAASLGFTNLTDSCVASPNCDFDRFAFLTDEFPTARIHHLLGNQIVDRLVQQLNRSKKDSDGDRDRDDERWHRDSDDESR